MLYHSVLQILPPFLSLLGIRKDIRGRAVGWAVSQLLPIILNQWGPAHQLHCGELFQKVPIIESIHNTPTSEPCMQMHIWILNHILSTKYKVQIHSHRTDQSDRPNFLRVVLLVFRDFFKFLICADSVHKVWLLIVIRGEDNVQHHTLQGLKHNGVGKYVHENHILVSVSYFNRWLIKHKSTMPQMQIRL